MAALNIANDLLHIKNERSTVATTIDEKVGELAQRVTKAIDEAKQLSL